MMISMTTATVTDVLEAIRALSPEEKEEVQRGLEAMNDDWQPSPEQVEEILRRAKEVDDGARTYSLDEVKAEMREMLQGRTG